MPPSTGPFYAGLGPAVRIGTELLAALIVGGGLGWLAQGKHDNPGTTCLWRGLVHPPNMVHGYVLALHFHGIRAGP